MNKRRKKTVAITQGDVIRIISHCYTNKSLNSGFKRTTFKEWFEGPLFLHSFALFVNQELNVALVGNQDQSGHCLDCRSVEWVSIS